MLDWVPDPTPLDGAILREGAIFWRGMGGPF